ncbi:MAG: hypothetical protein ACRD4L_10120, partial [Pyrinomonadaceae bacterium]
LPQFLEQKSTQSSTFRLELIRLKSEEAQMTQAPVRYVPGGTNRSRTQLQMAIVNKKNYFKTISLL